MPDILRGLCQVLQWLFVMMIYVISCLNVGATAQKSLLIVGGAMSVALNVTVDGPTPKKREKNKKRWSLSWFSAQLPHSLSRTSRTAIRDATCCAITGAFAYTAYQCLPTLTHQLTLLAMPIASILMLEDVEEAERRTKRRRKRKRKRRWKKPRFKSYSQLYRWLAWKKKHNAERRAAYRVTHKEYLHAKKKYKKSVRKYEAEMEREAERRKAAQDIATVVARKVRLKYGRAEMRSWEIESWGTRPDVEEETKTDTPPPAPPDEVETNETVEAPPPAPPNIEEVEPEPVVVEVEPTKTTEALPSAPSTIEDVEPLPPPAPPNIENVPPPAPPEENTEDNKNNREDVFAKAEAEMKRKHGRWKNESCGICSDARIRGSADRSRRRLLQVSTKALGSFFYARVPCLMI